MWGNHSFPNWTWGYLAMLISSAQQEISLKEQLFDAKYLDCGGHKVLPTSTSDQPIHQRPPMQFSLHCTKYDRHGYKARQRIFVITEKVSDGLFSDTVGHNLAPNLHTRVATYWNQEISKWRRIFASGKLQESLWAASVMVWWWLNCRLTLKTGQAAM